MTYEVKLQHYKNALKRLDEERKIYSYKTEGDNALDIYKDRITEIDAVKEAIIKQMELEPRLEKDEKYGMDRYYCPDCGTMTEYPWEYPYCPFCGKKIDWSKVEVEEEF